MENTNQSRSTVDASLVSTGFDHSPEAMKSDSICCEESLASQRKTLNLSKEAEYESNVAFIRSFCTMPMVLLLMTLMFASIVLSLFLTLNPLFVDGTFTIPLGLRQGAPILSFLSFLFSTLPLIGLTMLYVEANKPYAFTGAGFHVIRHFLWFSMKLLIIIGGLCVFPILIFLVRGFYFIDEGVILMGSISDAFAIALVIFAGIPVYRMYGAAKNWAFGLAYAIEQDEVAMPPDPHDLLKWMRWVLMETGIIAVFLFVVDLILVFSGLRLEYTWIGAALNASILWIGWIIIRRFHNRLVDRKVIQAGSENPIQSSNASH